MNCWRKRVDSVRSERLSRFSIHILGEENGGSYDEVPYRIGFCDGSPPLVLLEFRGSPGIRHEFLHENGRRYAQVVQPGSTVRFPAGDRKMRQSAGAVTFLQSASAGR